MIANDVHDKLLSELGVLFHLSPPKLSMVGTIIPVLCIKYFKKLRPKKYRELCKNFKISEMGKS